jgi:hypothetical protein
MTGLSWWKARSGGDWGDALAGWLQFFRDPILLTVITSRFWPTKFGGGIWRVPGAADLARWLSVG